jgi:hypothetical protein
MPIPLLDHPTPDFAEFCRVLSGEQPPRRVHLIEIGIDEEILQAITEQVTTGQWFSWEGDYGETPPEPYYEQLVTLFYRLGYDYVPIWATCPNHPKPKRRITADTAELATGPREWVEEGLGLSTLSARRYETDRAHHSLRACPGEPAGLRRAGVPVVG